MRIRTTALATGALALGLAVTPAHAGAESGLPLVGAEAEKFLREAEIVDREEIGVGITRPVKLTLRDGERTHHAVWKTVDVYRTGLKRGRKGGFQIGTRDSYVYEIAAYELDKALGLGLVPPTVLREVGSRKGSLQLWVQGAVTEADRRERGLEAPDPVAWSNQVYALRLFQSLVYDSDFLNIRNVLYDPSFRVYSVDHSRAFRRYPELLQEERLLRFSRGTLDRLRELSVDRLQESLGPWLSSAEIEGVLARRDKILDRASALVADFGAEVALYD